MNYQIYRLTRHFNSRFKQHLALAIFLAVIATGCSSVPVDPNDPASLYRAAQEEVESSHYQIAIDKFRAIKNKFPYSKYAIDSQLRIADVYFMQEAYIEAAASYESFRDLHPKHDRVAYAMAQIGKSYFKDIPSNVARDLTSAKRALDAYDQFARRFPTHEEKADATKNVAEIRNLLAEKELYIGDFYYKRDFYTSAEPRYRKVLDLYPDTEAAKQAQAKLTRIDSQAASKDNP